MDFLIFGLAFLYNSYLLFGLILAQFEYCKENVFKLLSKPHFKGMKRNVILPLNEGKRK